MNSLFSYPLCLFLFFSFCFSFRFYVLLIFRVTLSFHESQLHTAHIMTPEHWIKFHLSCVVEQKENENI